MAAPTRRGRPERHNPCHRSLHTGVKHVLAGRDAVNALSEAELRAMLAERSQALTAQRATFERLWTEAEPYLTPAERLSFQHTLRRLALEIDWHRELVAQAPVLVDRPPATGETG